VRSRAARTGSGRLGDAREQTGGVGGRSWSAQAVSQHGGVVRDGHDAWWQRATTVSARGRTMGEAVSSGRAICDSPTPCDTMARPRQGHSGCDTGTARRRMMLVRTS
jgi:hypothetical protein